MSALGELPSKLSVKAYLAPISNPRTQYGLGLVFIPKIIGIAKLSPFPYSIGFAIGIVEES